MCVSGASGCKAEVQKVVTMGKLLVKGIINMATQAEDILCASVQPDL